MAKKKLKKYQIAGKVAPITVTDPNDSRLKAYNDSLSVYNATAGNIAKLKSPEGDEWWKNRDTNYYKGKKGELGQAAYDRLTKLNGTPPSIIDKYTSPTSGGTAFEYKKPVQPVVYQKPQQAPIKKGQPTYEDSLNLYNSYYDRLKTLNLTEKDRLSREKNNLYENEIDEVNKNNFKTTRRKNSNIINGIAPIYDDLYPLATQSRKNVILDGQKVNNFTSTMQGIPYYKKPVGTPQPQEPAFKRPIGQGHNYPIIDEGTGRPNVGTPNMQQANFDMSKPTKFAFTYPDYEAGSTPDKQQKSLYFPDLQSLRSFSKGYGLEPSYGADNSWGQTLAQNTPENMKKLQKGGHTRLKKYQIAGKANPCGEGYAWNEATQQCVPIPPQTPIVPLKSSQDQTFDPNAGSQDVKGTHIPYNQWNPEAVDAGYEFNSDGKYRKKEFTETGDLAWKKNALGKAFPYINAALDATQLIANGVNDANINEQERRRQLEARYRTPEYNTYEKGINNVPAYFKHGGDVSPEKAKEILTDGTIRGKKITDKQRHYFGFIAGGGKPEYQVGGPAAVNVDSVLTANKNIPFVRRILEGDKFPTHHNPDGTVSTHKMAWSEADGKYYVYPTLDYNRGHYFMPKDALGYAMKNKNYIQFGSQEAADYFSQHYKESPLSKIPKKQAGGLVNTTGYLKNAATNKNPINIIPSNNITTKNMAFPIEANGMPLYPNTGDYKFNSQYVVEKPLMQAGGDVDEVEGVRPRNANAILEQGEIFQNQQGDINKVAESEPTHDQAGGGSPQPDVDRVLEDTADKRSDFASKMLRIKPTEVKEMFDFKPKKSLTHSKLYEEVIKRDRKDFGKFQKKIEANLDYIKANGGKFAKNSLDENLKLLTEYPTEGERFEQIYQHQEAVKQAYNISPMSQQKYQVGGAATYPSTWRNYYDNNQKKQYNAPTWITPTDFYSTPGLVDYMKTLDTLPRVDNDLKKADDSVWGYRHQLALDKFYPNGKPTVAPTSVSPTIPAGQGTSGTDNVGAQPYIDNTKYSIPGETKASTVNEGLGWSAGVGNVLGLLDTGRIPANFEQLNRDYYKVHEEDATPVINANTGDYNAAVEQLPNTGVGYANQANLQGQKYKFNNQAIAAVDSHNKQKFDARDADVEQKKFQLDQLNLALRKQGETETLIGKEKQRQQKFEYLNGIFKAIDEKNAFNRNANLALQLTPFFDAQGKFNGNKYKIAMNYDTNDGGRVEYIQDKQTNQQFRVVYDKQGKILSSSKLTTDNRAIGTPTK